MKAYCHKCEPNEKLKPPSQFKVIDWLEEIEREKEKSKKEGIQEVVDYIESRAIPNSFMPENTRTQWEQQLKEWGIKKI